MQDAERKISIQKLVFFIRFNSLFIKRIISLFFDTSLQLLLTLCSDLLLL